MKSTFGFPLAAGSTASVASTPVPLLAATAALSSRRPERAQPSHRRDPGQRDHQVSTGGGGRTTDDAPRPGAPLGGACRGGGRVSRARARLANCQSVGSPRPNAPRSNR
nr:hypothetical protein KPHV_70390 [Kitasatospora purpeofusca]